MGKQGLLVVSFGTSHKETRDKTIGALEIALKEAFKNREMRRAFTSGMIIETLKKRDNIYIDNVAEALEKFIKDGFEDILVQPTHIINGDEYEKIVRQAEPFRKKVKVFAIGRPLLTSSLDYDKTVAAVRNRIGEELGKDDALVLMGHGTGHFADGAYAALDYRFKAKGYLNVFVGTVEGYPDIETVIEKVIDFAPKKVVLMPLMIVAGDHAINDMAGNGEHSWKNIFENNGFTVECVLQGLGELEEIHKIFIDHGKAAEGK